MRSPVRLSLLALLACSILIPLPAHGSESGSLRLEVLVDGRPLPEYPARGTTYIEALRGREYSLRITNLEPVRVAVAVAVDGRNTIDARHTGARAARKWVLEPWQSIVLDGWQSSDRTARRFFFTTEGKSYAAWLGDPANAGVIEAIAFRERSRPVPSPWKGQPSRPGIYREGPETSPPREGADSAAGASEESGKRTQESAPSASNTAERRKDELDSAATGIGRSIGHEVVQVAFEAEDFPCGSVRLRYEYRDALVRLGVLPPRPPAPNPLDRRESARGFDDGPWCPVP